MAFKPLTLHSCAILYNDPTSSNPPPPTPLPTHTHLHPLSSTLQAHTIYKHISFYMCNKQLIQHPSQPPIIPLPKRLLAGSLCIPSTTNPPTLPVITPPSGALIQQGLETTDNGDTNFMFSLSIYALYPYCTITLPSGSLFVNSHSNRQM